MTGNTNSSQHKVYALFGEAYGSGFPLGYILVHLDNAAPGSKEQCIHTLLRYFWKTWKIDTIITLTDKD